MNAEAGSAWGRLGSAIHEPERGFTENQWKCKELGDSANASQPNALALAVASEASIEKHKDAGRVARLGSAPMSSKDDRRAAAAKVSASAHRLNGASGSLSGPSPGNYVRSGERRDLLPINAKAASARGSLGSAPTSKDDRRAAAAKISVSSGLPLATHRFSESRLTRQLVAFCEEERLKARLQSARAPSDTQIKCITAPSRSQNSRPSSRRCLRMWVATVRTFVTTLLHRLCAFSTPDPHKPTRHECSTNPQSNSCWQNCENAEPAFSKPTCVYTSPGELSYRRSQD